MAMKLLTTDDHTGGPAVQDQLSIASVSVRCGALRSKHLRTPRESSLADEVTRRIEDAKLHGQNKNPVEARGIVLAADSGQGKSHVIRRVLSSNASLAGSHISLQCQGSWTLKQLGLQMSTALGYPAADHIQENRVWQITREKISESKLKLIHIDEIGNIIRNANQRDLSRIIDTFKSLLNDRTNPVVLLLSGTPSHMHLLRSDAEFARRITWMYWDQVDGKVHLPLSAHIQALCQEVELVPPSQLVTNFVPRLIHAARYALGASIEMSIEAIKVALEAGDSSLTIDHAATLFARKYGVTHANNPFLAANWHEIVVG